jgi:thioredoxin 1
VSESADNDVVRTLTDDTFEAEVIASGEPYLVDFWAEWCGPCVALEPVIREIAAEQRDKLKVGRLDTIAHARTAARFGVMSVPTLLIFKDGELVKKIHGARNKRVLLSELKTYLGV